MPASPADLEHTLNDEVLAGIDNFLDKHWNGSALDIPLAIVSNPDKLSAAALMRSVAGEYKRVGWDVKVILQYGEWVLVFEARK